MNQADTAWMLISTALVLLMTPALGFFYGGLVRSKNALNTLMMSFISLGFVGIAWAVVGYSLAFAPGQRVDRRPVPRLPARRRPRGERHHPASPVHVLPGHVLHHHRGADLRRDRRADAVRGLRHLHHALGGRGLCPDRPLGLGRRLAREDGRARFRRRHGRARECRHRRAGGGARGRQAPRLSLVVAAAAQRARSRCSAPGCCGSAGSASTPAARWRPARSRRWPSPPRCSRRPARWSCGRCSTSIRSRKSTAVGCATAIVVGLVAITPAAGFVGPMSAIALGALAAFPSYFALVYRAKTSLDDSLDVVAAHGVGGTVGAVLTGVFAQKALNGLADGAAVRQSRAGRHPGRRRPGGDRLQRHHELRPPEADQRRDAAARQRRGRDAPVSTSRSTAKKPTSMRRARGPCVGDRRCRLSGTNPRLAEKSVPGASERKANGRRPGSP